MAPSQNRRQELTRRLFKSYPDYWLCRTLSENVEEGVTTMAEAVSHLARRAWVADENREAIQEKLDDYRIVIQGRAVRLKDLPLTEIMVQEASVLAEIVKFYCKHPFAHGRTRRSRLLPRWLRAFFLSTLLGHAKRRGLELDYPSCFEMLTLL